MTHPTDEELEAMAAKLDRKTHNMIEGHVQMEDAAAMLRACKGRVWVKALVKAVKEMPQDWYDDNCDCKPCEALHAALRALEQGER